MVEVLRRGVIAAALVGATLAPSRAAADDDDEGLLLGLPGFLLDSGFAAYAIASAFRNQPVDTAVLVPELIFGIPQYLGLNVMLGLGAYDEGIWETDEDPQMSLLGLMAPAMMGTAMTVHGLTTAMGDDLQPYRVVGVATVTGINLPFTSIMLGSAMAGRWSPPLVALVQVATTTPAMMGSAFAAAEDEPDRVGWSLLAGWSALQLAHGVTSLVLSDDHDSFESHGRSSERRDDEGLDLWAGPTLVSRDDGTQAPGLVLGGRF